MARNKHRPPTMKKARKPSPRPPVVSCGKTERTLLEYFAHKKQINETFKRRTAARDLHWHPTTTSDRLKKLVTAGLLDKVGIGTYVLTDTGKAFLQGTDAHHGACRTSSPSVHDKISMHAIKYDLNVSSRKFFKWSALESLGTVTPVPMKGWVYYKVEIPEGTLWIFPHKVTLNVNEVVSPDVELSLMRALNTAVDVTKRLEKVGIFSEGLHLDNAHYARIQSVLASALTQKLGRYQYKLEDGSSYWIDFSSEQIEGETDSAALRQRVDQFIEDLPKSTHVLSDMQAIETDIQGLKEVAHMILMHDANIIRIRQEQQQSMMQQPTQSRGDYIG